MNLFLKILSFTIPPLGILSGLSLAPLISIFLIALLMITKKTEQLSYQNKNSYIIYHFFLIWCGFSALWSYYPQNNLILFLKPLLLSLICMNICVNINNHTVILLRTNIAKPFFYGVVLSIIIFTIEYTTKGSITLLFRSIFQQSKAPIFNLYMLDRGCAFLSLASWSLTGLLIQNNKKLVALIFYFSILVLLGTSDSLASFLGFIAGGFAFLLLSLNKKFIWLIMPGVLILCLTLPIILNKMNPNDISQKMHWLPISAKHRLFIWNFTAKKIEPNLILGSGFNSSRYIAQDDDKVIYDGFKFELLPLHPHNNIMQILLETGIIGLCLFSILMCTTLNRIYNSFENIAAPAACFVNYFSIGMISFSVWQTWWFASSMFCVLILNIFINKKT